MITSQKKRLYVAFGILVSVVLIWVLFRNIDVVELVRVLKGANYWWLLPNIAMAMFAMYQRAYRWQAMMAPIKKVAYKNLLAATCVGFMANNVLPLRLGEFVRAYSLAYQDKGVTKSASLATIFVERMVLDLVALLLIFGAVLGLSHKTLPESIVVGTFICIGIALVGLGLMLTLALRPQQSGNMLAKWLFFAPDTAKESVRSIILKFSRGLEFMTKPGLLTWVLVQTIVLWIFMGVSNYFVFLAFGFDLPLWASFVLLVVVSISILIPSSPGFIGVYHAGTVLTLQLYAVPDVDARAFSLVLHAAQFIPITLMGFYFLRKEHLSLKNLEDSAVEGIGSN